MEQIKFRTFINNKFYYWGYLEHGFTTPVATSGKPIELVHQQYIGLKDKNNIEVYEGDIIQSNKETIKVVWYKEGACFSAEYLDGECADILGDYIEDGIVIGNIYENKELL